MRNPRYSTGPTSQRVRDREARRKMEQAEKYAPGLSLDMMKKGGKVKKMAGGGYAGTTMPGSPPPTGPTAPTAPNPCPPGTTYLPGRGCIVNEYEQVPPLPPQTPPIEPEEYERRIRGTREGMMGGRRMAKGGSVKSSASKRADGIAQRGKTRGRFV